jgi:chromate transporter
VKHPSSLKEIALLFLKLGVIGFGGPAVHIAMMEDEVVRKRKWLTHQHFLDLVGATNLIPGPNSTEMTMHIGRERAGWKGLVVAGACFIVPAVIITAFFAWIYRDYGHLPSVGQFIYGIKPAILSVVVVTMVTLAGKVVKKPLHGIILLIAFVLALAGVNEIMLLFGAGALAVLLQFARQKGSLHGIFPFVLLQVIHHPVMTNSSLFLKFLKIGSILYGSGYVLFSFLDAEFVSQGLFSREILVDAIAVGQFTPGPVFSSATFIGWQINGWEGAIAATLGIFLPSFLFVALLNPLIPMLRRSKLMSAFLDTVNIVAIAIILVLVVNLGIESVQDWRTMLIAFASFAIAFFNRKINTAWIVLGGAISGYVLLLV